MGLHRVKSPLPCPGTGWLLGPRTEMLALRGRREAFGLRLATKRHLRHPAQFLASSPISESMFTPRCRIFNRAWSCRRSATSSGSTASWKAGPAIRGLDRFVTFTMWSAETASNFLTPMLPWARSGVCASAFPSVSSKAHGRHGCTFLSGLGQQSVRSGAVLFSQR